MHPRTPQRLRRFSETHRQVGAICHAATHLEYQLELAALDLGAVDDLEASQGLRWSELIKRLKGYLNNGIVPDPSAETSLRDLLGRVAGTLRLRDQVVHSSWMFTNQTAPGQITGLRFRTRGEERRDWSPDALEAVREDLEALTDELSTVAWNAVRPPEEHL